VYQSLARAASVRAWNRPTIDDGPGLWISEGRHPVVEANLPRGSFVPNDLALSFGNADEPPEISFALITGPNMAGKSTYLRQAALIAVMAQVGSFVPVREARIGVVDRIFCRVGSSDNLARGESTFLVEMNETAHILRNASARSLVIMDEVGRGTGTNDGLAIAWAVCEELLDGIGCRTLFATHYHELSRIRHPRLANRSMDVDEQDGQIVFLKRLKEGATEQSYGIHVARLAGLPDQVIERASAILDRLSSKETKLSAALAGPLEAASVERPKNDTSLERLSIELEAVNPDRLNPLEALELVYRLKGLAKRRLAARTARKNAEPELF
jgi:DNA mismatch repair protein MutS